jgi:hypothetical protein
MRSPSLTAPVAEATGPGPLRCVAVLPRELGRSTHRAPRRRCETCFTSLPNRDDPQVSPHIAACSPPVSTPTGLLLTVDGRDRLRIAGDCESVSTRAAFCTANCTVPSSRQPPRTVHVCSRSTGLHRRVAASAVRLASVTNKSPEVPSRCAEALPPAVHRRLRRAFRCPNPVSAEAEWAPSMWTNQGASCSLSDPLGSQK